jgi:hypothetical protein
MEGTWTRWTDTCIYHICMGHVPLNTTQSSISNKWGNKQIWNYLTGRKIISIFQNKKTLFGRKEKYKHYNSSHEHKAK